MKARVHYASGWMLTISKEGMSPLLFLEWASQFPGGRSPIYKILNDNDGDEPQSYEGTLRIRLNGTREDYQDAAAYINLNS